MLEKIVHNFNDFFFKLSRKMSVSFIEKPKTRNLP